MFFFLFCNFKAFNTNEISSSDCILLNDLKDNKEGTFILKELASSVKDCAELCRRTQSGSMWTYDKISRMCSVHSTNRYDTNFKKERGHISGSVECADLTIEEWDQKMFATSNREYGKELPP